MCGPAFCHGFGAALFSLLTQNLRKQTAQAPESLSRIPRNRSELPAEPSLAKSQRFPPAQEKVLAFEMVPLDN